MKELRLLVALSLAWAFGGCATQSYAPDVAPEYAIIREYTPFYRNGPLQGMGPDASLRVSARVKLLRQEMGYSLVQLEDGRTGYVANENMAPAPPRPPQPEVSSDGGSQETSRAGGRKKRASSPQYTGEQLNDIPLPDPNVPLPDLNVAPEELPVAMPSPTPSTEKPKFRY